jgi:hypothetical protein
MNEDLRIDEGQSEQLLVLQLEDINLKSNFKITFFQSFESIWHSRTILIDILVKDLKILGLGFSSTLCKIEC